MNKNFSLPSLMSPPQKAINVQVHSLTPSFNKTQFKFNPMQNGFKKPGEMSTVKYNRKMTNPDTGYMDQINELKLSGLLKKRGESQEQSKTIPDRGDLMSRETLFRFYEKDNNKMKRLITPGYVGLDSVQCFYKKYNNMSKEIEKGIDGYSASTAYLTKV